MHGPMLKSWLDANGLTPNDLARVLDIKVRTIKYWLNFERPAPPEGVVQLIEQFIATFEARVEYLWQQSAASLAPIFLAYRAPEDLAHFDPESFQAGITPAVYRVILWRARTGRPIRFLEAAEYSRWLSTTGVPDSLESRALWAQGFEPINQRNAPAGMLNED